MCWIVLLGEPSGTVIDGGRKCGCDRIGELGLNCAAEAVKKKRLCHKLRRIQLLRDVDCVWRMLGLRARSVARKRASCIGVAISDLAPIRVIYLVQSSHVVVVGEGGYLIVRVFGGGAKARARFKSSAGSLAERVCRAGQVGIGIAWWATGSRG